MTTMSTLVPTPFSDATTTWNRRFEGAAYLFGTSPNVWLKEHADVWKPGQRVLCVADGEGRNSVWLARQGLIVDAFDIAEGGVAKARQLAQEHGVSVNFAISDCDAYSWQPRMYDGVAAIFVQFADPAMRERLFTNIQRCLKLGGTLVLQGYTPNSSITRLAARLWQRICTQWQCCARPLPAWRSSCCTSTRPKWRRGPATMGTRP
jgi:2-polyprenyl-3-methyl-5-hydroxy-6-metoxy-1,4-benzoquinol methylase